MCMSDNAFSGSGVWVCGCVVGLSGGACRNRQKIFDISQDHWHIMLLQPLNTIAARTLSKFSAKAQPQSWKHVSPRAGILKHVRVPLCLITLVPSVVNDRRSDLHVRAACTCACELGIFENILARTHRVPISKDGYLCIRGYELPNERLSRIGVPRIFARVFHEGMHEQYAVYNHCWRVWYGKYLAELRQP